MNKETRLEEMSHLAEEIRAIGLNKFSKLYGIDKSYMSRLINLKITPRPKTIQKVKQVIERWKESRE